MSLEPAAAEALEQILDQTVRPTLLAHGGNVVIASFEDGLAVVRLTGACCSCPGAMDTFETQIKAALMTHPAVKAVSLSDGCDPELMNLARKLLQRKRGDSQDELGELLSKPSTDTH